MKHSLIRTSLFGVLGGAAALVAMALARGGGGSADATTTTTSPTTTSPNSTAPGFMVAKDPATGQLRAPTAEEMAALQPSKPELRRESALRSERLANGAVVTTLDRSYDLYSVASRGSDGKIREACVPAYQLEATLKAAQESTVNTEEGGNEK